MSDTPKMTDEQIARALAEGLNIGERDTISGNYIVYRKFPYRGPCGPFWPTTDSNDARKVIDALISEGYVIESEHYQSNGKVPAQHHEYGIDGNSVCVRAEANTAERALCLAAVKALIVSARLEAEEAAQEDKEQ